MHFVRRSRSLWLAAVVAAAVLSCGPRSAGPSLGGKIVAVVGDGEILRAGSDAWVPADVGAAADFGDSLRTGAESKIEIRFGPNAVTVDESSVIAINREVDSTGKGVIEIYDRSGSVLSNIQKLAGGPNSFRVRTPTAVAAIRGTHFYVTFDVETDLSRVNVYEGRVWVVNPLLPPAPPVIVLPGLFTEVRPAFIPVVPVAIPYGQWKKMVRVMPQPMYLRYHRKLKFHRHGPPGVFLPGPPGMHKGKPSAMKFRGPGPAVRGPVVKGHGPTPRGPAVVKGRGPAGPMVPGPARPGVLRPGGPARPGAVVGRGPAGPMAPAAVRRSAGPVRPLAPGQPRAKVKGKGGDDDDKEGKGKKKK